MKYTLHYITFTLQSPDAHSCDLRRQLGVLFVPRSHTSTIGPWAFAISSPSAWNSLPVDLRDSGLCLLSFRKKLKTYLFNVSVH